MKGALDFASSINQPEIIIPSKILELAYRSGSKILFFTTFKWVESAGQLPNVFQSDDQINRYISIFREMWADYVYLESID